MQKDASQNASRKSFPAAVLLAVIVIAAIAIAGVLYFKPTSQSPYAVLPAEPQVATAEEAVGTTTQYEEQAFYYYPSTPSTDPTRYPVRVRYFREAFQISRESYDLFEKASKKLDIPLEQVPQYFLLRSEEDIWDSLPEPPKDFGETAYLIASGREYAIGALDESYYLQPEFYPGFKDAGMRFWSDPDPRLWAANGYGAYPTDQWDTLERGKREDFTAVVYVYSGFGVQTFQGVKLAPTPQASEYFDVSVSPEVFLLEPTFPEFERAWVQKVVIVGRLKPNAPQGDYVVGLNLQVPPAEKIQEWSFKYRSLYYNAATAIGPSGNTINLYITVK